MKKIIISSLMWGIGANLLFNAGANEHDGFWTWQCFGLSVLAGVLLVAAGWLQSE